MRYTIEHPIRWVDRKEFASFDEAYIAARYALADFIVQRNGDKVVSVYDMEDEEYI